VREEDSGPAKKTEAEKAKAGYGQDSTENGAYFSSPPTNQPINQPTNQLTNQPINQPTNQTNKQTNKCPPTTCFSTSTDARAPLITQIYIRAALYLKEYMSILKATFHTIPMHDLFVPLQTKKSQKAKGDDGKQDEKDTQTVKMSKREMKAIESDGKLAPSNRNAFVSDGSFLANFSVVK